MLNFAHYKSQKAIKQLLILSLLVLLGCKTNKGANSFAVDEKQIKSGDLIFRRSYGLISDIIVARLDDNEQALSHCGIAHRDSANKLYVIHALPLKLSKTDGMQICTFADFVSDCRPGTLKVTRFLPDSSGTIESWALRYLGASIPFDAHFDTSDSTAFFCTELPLHIIESQFQLHLVNKDSEAIPTFSIFFQPDYFEEIELY